MIPFPTVKDLIQESKDAIDHARDIIRQARAHAVTIRGTIEGTRGAARENFEELEAFDDRAIRIESAIFNVHESFKEIEEFRLSEFESWNEEGERDREIDAKIDRRRGK